MRINPFFLHGEELTPVRKLLALHALAGSVPLTEYTVTGNPVSFETNVAKPLSECLVSFSPVQSGTGDPSPDNVRPITGWNGANVWRTGKNLCNLTIVQGGITAADGSETSAANRVKSSDYIMFKGGTKYTISASGAGQVWLFYYDRNKQYITGGGSGFKNLPFTKQMDSDTYIRLVFRKSTNDENLTPADVQNLQIEIGETASEYSAYTGQTVSVTFPALGKNLFDKNAVQTGKTWWKGNKQDWNNANASAKIPVIPGETYTLYRSSTSQNQVLFFNADGVYLSQDLVNWGSTTATNTIPAGVYYVAFNVEDVSLDTAMFVKGNSVGSYEPYNATAYGGTLDLSTGVLTVEHKDFTKTWGDYISKTVLGDNTRGVLSIASYPSKAVGQAADAKCNIAPRGTGWSTDNVHFYTNEGSCIVILPNDTDDSTEIQVVYPLATPLVYQLTPTEILSLVGDNVLWSDLNGDLTVVYKKKG